MPPNQSSPSAGHGATPASVAVAMTLSERSAAQARAWGPPPDWPAQKNRPIRSVSRIAWASVATSPTARPAIADDAAYPGREKVTRRMSRLASSATSGGYAPAADGVPLCHSKQRPFSGPAVTTSSCRPSGACTVCVWGSELISVMVLSRGNPG
jgi:hypothetical protein